MITSVETEGNSVGDVYYQLFMNETPVSGQPSGAITTNPDWELKHTETTNYPTSATQQEVMTNIGLIIPPNTTVGLAVLGFMGTTSPGGTHVRYYTIPSGFGVQNFSSDGVNLIMGENVSYGFGSYTATSYNHPRGFVGTINFEPVSQTPCSGTPDAGTITGVNEICPSINFGMNIPYP